MKKQITIEVTAEDIEKAKRNDSYTCVVAQSIMRTFPAATRPVVDIQTIKITQDGERWQWLTPYAAQGYIVAFDAGDDIEPFTFQLRNPTVIRRSGRTTAGLEVEAAASRARDHARKAGLPEDQVKAAASKARKTTQAKVAEAATPPSSEDIAPLDALKMAQNMTKKVTDGPRPARAMYANRKRSYGHRLMRANQDRTDLT